MRPGMIVAQALWSAYIWSCLWEALPQWPVGLIKRFEWALIKRVSSEDIDRKKDPGLTPRI